MSSGPAGALPFAGPPVVPRLTKVDVEVDALVDIVQGLEGLLMLVLFKSETELRGI